MIQSEMIVLLAVQLRMASRPSSLSQAFHSVIQVHLIEVGNHCLSFAALQALISSALSPISCFKIECGWDLTDLPSQDGIEAMERNVDFDIAAIVSVHVGESLASPFATCVPQLVACSSGRFRP